MKKYLINGVLLFGLFILTGCGNETVEILVCNQSVSGVNVELNIQLMGKKVNDMSMKYTMDVSSYNDVQIDALKKQDFCNVVRSTMSGYQNAFNNCKQDVMDNTLLITAQIDVNKVEDNSIKEQTTSEAVKKALEGEGYTCIMQKNS